MTHPAPRRPPEGKAHDPEHEQRHPPGSSANHRTEETFTGPLNSFWATDDMAPALVYVPCDEQRILNINTALRVDDGTSTARSSMSITSSKGDVDTLFNVSRARC